MSSVKDNSTGKKIFIIVALIYIIFLFIIAFFVQFSCIIDTGMICNPDPEF